MDATRERRTGGRGPWRRDEFNPAAMLLVVDVGNTQTHFGTFDGPRLVEHWRFATVRESTADELGAVVRNLLALRGMRLQDLTGPVGAVPRPPPRPGGEGGGDPH